MSTVASLNARLRTGAKLLIMLSPMIHRIAAPLALIAVGSFALSACRRERAAPVVMTVARGNEPFWSVDVRTDRLLLSRLGMDSVAYPYAPADFDADGRAVYRARRFGDDPLLTLVIERGDCSDGMSDQRYPGSAVLTRGDSMWRGCATILPDSVAKK